MNTDNLLVEPVDKVIELGLNLKAHKQLVDYCSRKLNETKVNNLRNVSTAGKKVFLCVSWLPISKSSGHVLVFLKLLKIFQSLGYKVHIIVSGLNFESDRAAKFLSEKSVDALKDLYLHVFEKVYLLNYSDIEFHFPLNIDSKYLSFRQLAFSIDSFIDDLKPSSSDIFLLTSGNLSCRYLDVLAKSNISCVLVKMTNNLDNITRFSSFANKIIVQSLDDASIQLFLKQGFSHEKLVETQRDFVFFEWQKKLSLTDGEKKLFEFISDGNFKTLILIVSSRLKAKQSNIELLHKSLYKDQAMIVIGGQVLQGVDNCYSIGWSDNICNLIRLLAMKYNLLNIALDSGGGYTNSCVAFSGGVNIVPVTSDSASFVPTELKYIEVAQLVSILENYESKSYERLKNNTAELVEKVVKNSNDFTKRLLG